MNNPSSAAPFQGSRLKIARARKHLAELEQEIATYIRDNPARFDIKIPDRMMEDGDRRSLTIEVKFHIPGIPQEMGPIIGDIVHNLRSSLDIMACELARLNGKSDKSVYFPFCDKPDDLEKIIKERNFHRAGIAAVALLKKYRPHKGGNIALRALHDLAVQDKHQTPIPSAVSAATPALEIKDETGTPIWPSIVGDPHSASNMRIVFPDGGLFAREEVIPTLHDLVEITAGIIEEFEVIERKRLAETD